ncbi:MAG: hypothetical protein F6K21_24755 [Symploca sp. SIO2D2]|nr:hypothetical protein [Symploca sp. SIO2D2]
MKRSETQHNVLRRWVTRSQPPTYLLHYFSCGTAVVVRQASVETHLTKFVNRHRFP